MNTEVHTKNLYEPCPTCNAHRVARDSCRACDGEGYVATGLSDAQVEAHAGDARRLQIVKAVRISLLAPPEPGKGWLAQTAFVPGRGVLKFRGDDPRGALDLAIRRLGL